MEEWRVVKDFPNYEISTYGNVYNRRNDRMLNPCIDRSHDYAVVNLYDHNGKFHRRYVHRLVAEAFIPNPRQKRTINHIDCNKANNHISNLEWATDSENMLHAFENNLCENTRRAAAIQQKILSQKPRTQRQRDVARENLIRANKRPKTERQLEAMRRNINSPLCRARANEKHFDRHPYIKVIETGEIFRSQRALAAHLGVGESAICACLHGRRKHASGYHFEYVKTEVV